MQNEQANQLGANDAVATARQHLPFAVQLRPESPLVSSVHRTCCASRVVPSGARDWARGRWKGAASRRVMTIYVLLQFVLAFRDSCDTKSKVTSELTES